MRQAFSNFHTHTPYCDGKASISSLIEEALEKGFRALGFSGHGYTSFDTSYAMDRERERAYFEELSRLKTEYAGRLELYCGLEMDALGDAPTLPWDYIIGSQHYLLREGGYCEVDSPLETLRQEIDRYWGGDWYAFTESYYEALVRLPERTGADLIGHMDLVTLHNEGDRLFSTSCSRYLDAAYTAVDELVKTGLPFEINTGAMSRGYRSTPYPQQELLLRIHQKGGRLLLTSDCHHMGRLDYAFQETAERLEALGIPYETYLPRLCPRMSQP